MARTPTDPTKAQVWITKGLDDLDFEFYFPQGPKGDPGGIVDGVILGTADLNTIVTTGLYRQIDTSGTGSLVRNYPYPSGYGTLLVLVTSGGDVEQTFYPQFYNSEIDGRTFYRRNRSNGIWNPWRAFNSTRVDQTAGRAMYQWDDLNNREQLIYGDTGWREVSSNLLNGATATQFQLRRRNDSIYARINTLKLPSTSITDAIFIPPAGFRTTIDSTGLLREQIATGNAFGFTYGGNVVLYGTVATGANNTTHRFSGLLQATTDEPWPTTLPGVADGTIPNL